MKKNLSLFLAVCLAAGLFAFPMPAKAQVYNLTLSASPQSIASGGTVTLTAMLTDNGDAFAGQTINWSITSGTGSLNAGSSQTDPGGQATVTFTAAQPGAVTVKAEYGSESATANITVTAPQAYSLTLDAVPPSIANGGKTTLTATLTDNGSPVNGQQVNWAIIGGTGGGSLNATSVATNSGGKAAVTFTASQAGTAIIKATLHSNNNITAQTSVTITAPQAPSLTLSAYPSRFANGTATTLTATLTDNGNALAGQQINWSILTGGTGGGSLGASSSITDNNGRATVSFKASKIGTAIIKATLNGNNAISAQTTVTIDPTYSLTVSASPASIASGGSTTLTATLRDNGVAVSGQQVNWSFVSGATGSGSLAASYTTTNSNGQTSITFKATKNGSVTIRATLNSNSAVYGQTAITISPTYGLSLSASPASIANGGNTVLTATLRDNGVAVSNQRINWSFVSGATGGGSLGASYSTTNSNGQASVNFKASRIGTVTIRATLQSNSAVYAQTSVTIGTPVTQISLSQTGLTLYIGSSQTLTATVAPANATNTGLTWTSSNTRVATVNSGGRVTGVSAGTATITATAADGGGARAICNVSVINSNQPTISPFPVVSVANIKNAAVRPNANTKGKILGRLKKGAGVRVLGYTNGYFSIPWPNASGKAYVSASQLNVAFSPALTGTSIRNFSVYTRTSTLKKYRIAVIPKGVAVSLTGRYGSWYRIDFNGYVAYAQVKDISLRNQ